LERIFLFYDSDVFYTTRFLEYFKKKKDFDFEIAVFTREESLGEYLQAHPVEILLLGNQIILNKLPADRASYIYKLVDSYTTDMDEDYHTILKYQPAQKIMSEILSDYTNKVNEKRPFTNSKQGRIISVFTPVHSLEALLFTWSAALQLSERKKVLLILLDIFQIQVLETFDNRGQALSEVIYYLKDNKDYSCKWKVLSSCSGNLSCLSGVAHGADILALSKEDMQKWTEDLRLHTDYQEMIFFLDCYSEAVLECMNLSDLVFAVDKEAFYEKAIAPELSRQLDMAGIDRNKDTYRRIMLPVESGIDHLPVTAGELSNTSSWDLAKQSLSLLF
jgi:hypothetical protein